MERMSNDIAVSATGAVILRRAARLVGTVEGLLERQAKLASTVLPQATRTANPVRTAFSRRRFRGDAG
ncbi:hypothetical protein HNP83_006481 [Rhizobium leguminosarum]|nr:hypothetical protein [Rhizobium leguminosarum]